MQKSESTMNNSMLICIVCNQQYVSPIVLTCGETVCARHVKENRLLVEDHKISCPIMLCDEGIHVIPKGGFKANRHVEILLQEAKEISEKHQMAKDSVNRLNSKIVDIEILIRDPEKHIYDYFQKVRNEIDIKAETMKKDIDDQRDEFLKKIKTFEQECKEKAKETERIQRIKDIIQSVESQVKEWNQQVNKLLLQNEEALEITKKVDDRILQLEKDLIKSQNFLLQNKSCLFKSNPNSTTIGQINFVEVEGIGQEEIKR